MENTTEKKHRPSNEREASAESRSPLHEYGHKGRQAKTDRIVELDQEWDAERTLLLNAALVTLSGALLGAFVSKKWLILSAAAAVVMAEQALTGWSPPLAIMKKLGKRTKDEITRERYGLKAMKGDFKNASDSEKVWESTE
ncbi:MAG TPA: DUF2892 domain-containing protein [Bacteroidia bacterium]|nr:DUF2892 domain-containing protein [Bacteroidia bacterium]